MKARGRVRPSKPASALGLVVGLVFVCIGVGVAIPSAGAFGVLWTLLAVIITGYHALNVFSEDGVAHQVVEFDTSPYPKPSSLPAISAEQRLRNLDGLVQKGLITEEEYAQERARILDEL